MGRAGGVPAARLNKIDVFSDGAARGNPGPAAIAYAIYDETGKCVESNSRLIGRATNNEAEYQALMLAMDRAHVHCTGTAHFHLDSTLVVNQVNGEYRAKDERMREFLREVLSRMGRFAQARVTHVPREDARIQFVDWMVNKALDRAA